MLLNTKRYKVGPVHQLSSIKKIYLVTFKTKHMFHIMRN